MHFGGESLEFEEWGVGTGVKDHDAEFGGWGLRAGWDLGREEVE